MLPHCIFPAQSALTDFRQGEKNEKREKCVSTERQFRRSAVRFFVQVCGLSFFLWPTKGMFALSLAASQQKASSRGKRRPLNAEGKADHSPGREKKRPLKPVYDQIGRGNVFFSPLPSFLSSSVQCGLYCFVGFGPLKSLLDVLTIL